MAHIAEYIDCAVDLFEANQFSKWVHTLWRRVGKISASLECVNMAEVYSYKITLKTADVSGAGTDADVYVILKGTAGETEKIDLDSDGDNFEQGKTDTFLRGTNRFIGELWGVELGHDDSGGGSGWKPESIAIYPGEGRSDQSAPSNDTGGYTGGWGLGSLFRSPINKWLSSDNDGWQGAGEESLKIELGTRPKEVNPEIRPPKGDWKDYPTGVIAGVRVYNTTGASITTGISKTVQARISRTDAEMRKIGQEYTESVEVTFSTGAPGLAESETKFGFSATQRKEVETQLVEMQEASQARTQQMTFGQEISLEEGQVALVVFEIYEIRRSEPGEIRLGSQSYIFSDFITYQVPYVEYFGDGSDELEQKLREYANDPDTKELVSKFALAKYAN